MSTFLLAVISAGLVAAVGNVVLLRRSYRRWQDVDSLAAQLELEKRRLRLFCRRIEEVHVELTGQPIPQEIVDRILQ